MNAHETCSDLLPFYAAGHLASEQRAAVESHLPTCATCQRDLALWQAVGGEVTAANRELAAPGDLADRALAQIHFNHEGYEGSQRLRAALPSWNFAIHRIAVSFVVNPWRATWQLLWAQVPLVQREIWPAVALVMAIGFVIAILVNSGMALRVLAPLVTAASLAVIYGPEHDPTAELSLSTPTSPWKILLARVTLVFGYNLVLALVVSLLLQVFIPVNLNSLILGWLAPMTFLSALALVLSLWIGTANALVIAYAGWLAQFVPFLMRPMGLAGWFARFGEGYVQFWQSPAILLSAALLLFAAALWSAHFPERSLRLRL